MRIHQATGLQTLTANRPNTQSRLEPNAAAISDVITEVSFAYNLESCAVVITYILKREVHAV